MKGYNCKNEISITKIVILTPLEKFTSLEI